MSEMNHKATIEKIVSIEKAFDVNTLVYHDINIWPIIRHAIHYQYLRPNANFTQKTNQSYEKSILTWQYPDIKQLNGIPILFFSRTIDYSDQWEGNYYNRHIDPLCDVCNSKWNYVKIELQSNESLKTLPRFEPTLFIEHPKSNGISSNSEYRISEFDAFLKIVFEIDPTLRIDEEVFIYKSHWVNQYYLFFKELFEQVQPRIVFQVNYGNIIGFALNKAAKHLGILSVDIQHGFQNPFHGEYTHWTRIPAKGYELLPDIFWTWGNPAKNNIEKWQIIGSEYPKAVVGGNRFLGMWKEKLVHENTIAMPDAFQNIIQGKEKIILITLQTLANPLPDQLISAMKRSQNNNWIWLVRLHPLQRQHMTEIRTILDHHGIRNYEIHFATLMPLYQLLNLSDHMVTCFSTVCYEALAFDVPVTLVHPASLDFFKDDIDSGIFSYSLTCNAILDSIVHVNSSSKETIAYIETSKQHSEQALKNILQSQQVISREVNEQQGLVFNLIGETLYQKGNVQEARHCFEKALLLCQNDFNIHNNLAVVYWENNEWSLSLRHFVRALELNPQDKTTLINCVHIFKSLNQPDDARAIIIRYLKEHPNDPEMLIHYSSLL
ncbi:MAG: tetratricopeptide repeat protein [Desulfobacterales bacterium]|nr:tetratricopeptide repeat protein [Desulfobacterales bacterium]